MTANHEHTPKALSTEFVRDMFEIAAVYTGNSESMEAATPHFNRWHSAEIAAAEQRGAERVLREVADHMHENTSVIIDGDKYTACSSCTSIYRQYLDYRADQIANKEDE